jgi:hypothetical protein
MRTPFARQLSAFGSGPKARDASASGLRSAVNLWAPGGERLRSRYGTRIVGAGPVDLLPAGRTLVVNGTTADADRVIAASGDDIYVGSEDVFHGFWVSPSVSITPTEHYRLQVEYWNGTEWAELDALDGTARYVSNYQVPLYDEGEVHFVAPADWATRAVAGYALLAFVYWVRFRVQRIRDAAPVWPFLSWSNSAPGFRTFVRRPVNGLEVLNVKRARQILVGADRKPRPYMGGMIPAIFDPQASTSRILNPTWRFGSGTVRDGNEVPEGRVAGDPITTATIGTADTVVDTSDRSDMPLGGYIQKSPWGAIVASGIAPSAAGVNTGYQSARFDTLDPVLSRFGSGDLEGFLLEVTTAGGFGSVGDRYEIIKTTVAGGSMQILFGPTAGAPTTTTRFSLVTPPSVFSLGYDRKEYEVGGPPASAGSFPVSSYSFHASPNKTINRFEVKQQSRYALLAGAQYSAAVHPTDGTLLFSNGGTLYVYDGDHLRPLQVAPPDSPLAREFSAKYQPIDVSDQGTDPSVGTQANQFRGAPPPASLVTVFQGRIIVARDNILNWSAPTLFCSLWPLNNAYRCVDGEGGKIQSLAVRDSVLLVSTRAATYEIQFNDRGAISVRQGNTEGFLSHRGTKLMVFEGATGIVGPTEKGVQVYTSGDPARILERWTDLIPEGVDTRSLELSPGVFAPSLNTYMVAVRANGQDSRKTLAVFDAVNKAWWRWTLPFGVETMAVDTAGAGVDRILLGCSDGMIRAFTLDDYDDATPVEWSLKTHPISFFGSKVRALVQSVRVVARNTNPPNCFRLKLWMEDDAQLWLDDTMTWYNPDPTFEVNDGFNYTRFAASGLLSIEQRIPSGTSGASAVLELSGNGDLDLQSILIRGVER